MGKQWKPWHTLFSWAQKSLQMATVAMKLKDACSLEEKQWQPRQCIKKHRNYFAFKGLYCQSYVFFFFFFFSSSHIWMWDLDDKKGWEPKNWFLRTVVLEKILESPLDSKDIKPVNLKGINTKYSLEGLIPKLKLQYFGLATWYEKLTQWKRFLCWERLKAGGGVCDRG